MSTETTKRITAVADIATEAAFETVTKRLAGGGDFEMITHHRLGFSLEEYLRRYELVLAAMAERGLDALCLRSPENITYMTGYETPGYYKYHCLVMGPGFDPVLILRRFESLNIPEYAWIPSFVPVDDWEHPPTLTAHVLRLLGLGEGERIGGGEAGLVLHRRGARDPDARPALVHLRGRHRNPVERAHDQVRRGDRDDAPLRRDPRQGGAVGHGHVRPRGVGRPGQRRGQPRAAREHRGVHGPCPPSSSRGRAPACPTRPRAGETIGERDLVYFEVSCSQWRYAAAIMRTIFIGEPDARQRACAEAVIGAVDRAMEVIRPGVTSEEVDREARAVVEKAGFGDYFRHRLGYSIGVNYPPDWGEGEIISLRRGEERELRAGMTFHMVPLCLLYRDYGVGFSETIRVTDTGCERFSSLPREVVVK